MCSVIDNPASCEICVLISFFHAKDMSAEEIHRELCATVCSQNVVSEGTVSQWCSTFRDGQTNEQNIRFEVFTAMTMKKAVFWDVALCRCGVSEERIASIFRVEGKIRKSASEETVRTDCLHQVR
jgi:hypothetical protein